MDAFTQNILSRARERQRMLGEDKSFILCESNKSAVSEPNLTEIKKIPCKVQSDSNIHSKTTSTDEGLPQGVQMKTLNIQRDSFNMEIKVKSSENVRVEVEIEEHENNGNYIETCSPNHKNKENVGLREESKNRLKRLGKLYAGGDDAGISSPIHRTEAQFYKDISNEDVSENNEFKKDPKCKKGLSKLADLADSINHWEDDLSHPIRPVKSNTPQKSWKPPAPQPPVSKQELIPTRSLKPRAPSPPNTKISSPKKVTFHKENTTSQISTSKSLNDCPKKENLNNLTTCHSSEPTAPKQINWDKKVLDTLEQKGQQTGNKTGIRKVQFEAKNPSISEEIEVQPKPHCIPNKVNKNLESESKKTDIVDQQSKHYKSGAIANRAAMFEEKLSSNNFTKPDKDPALLPLAERKALFEKNKGDALVPKAAFGMSAPVKVDTTMKASETKFIGVHNKCVGGKQDNCKENLKVTKKPLNLQVNQEVKNCGSKILPTPQLETKELPRNLHQGGSSHSKETSTVAMVHQSEGIANKMAALLENKSTISEEQIANKVKTERQKEIDMLLNRFNKNKKIAINQDVIEEVPSDSDNEETDETTAMLKGKPAVIINQPRRSAEKRKSGGKKTSESDSPNVVSVLEDVKRIKVSPAKAGRLYPNLSDIEATTTETDTRTPTPNEENSYEESSFDSADPNTSFGRDILETVCKNVTPQRKESYPEVSSSENSSVLEELDEILEEMEDDTSSTGPTPPKQGRHYSPKHTKAQQSDSFHYKSFTSSSSQKSDFQSPKKVISPRQSMDLPLVVDGEQVLSLTHTVSFYRKQQNEVHTPIRQISRQPLIEEESETLKNSSDDEVEETIRRLQEEVNKQQNIIAQTSQALNLCSSTPEFSGSTEQVEAEKVLLVATHRRQAALHELQRIKVEGTLRPLSQHSKNLPLEKGTLTISNITLPMKQKYVTALAAAGGKGHHVVCLIKCGEQVIPTKLVSTVASKSKNPDVDLYIPGSVTLNNIYSDFTVTLEVYCLQAQEEFLPHEVKYHINKKTSKNLTTPKKSKQDSRLVRPPTESPAGPQIVRTSSFALMGYIVFSVQAVKKKVWSLNNTPSMSPLEGSVEMKIDCELAVSVEHRGFLTMFEDISGFGAWHRRWCLLKGHLLSYWKYPDDERKVAPIDTIDLKTCITKEVGPVSRDICARLHTFLLERERPAKQTDKATLVLIRKGDRTIIRHLLSADTKEERIEWCYKLNAALTAIRMWGNKLN